MSSIMNRTNVRVRTIMEQFPSEEAVITRPVNDKYGQPSGTAEIVCTLRVWREAMNKPSKWAVDSRGLSYSMLNAEGEGGSGTIWVAALKPLPAELRSGDRVTIGEDEYTLRNMYTDSVGVRYHLQLEVSGHA